MKKIFTLWLSLLPFLIAVDCGGGEPTAPPTPTEILTADWDITTIVIDGQSQPPSSQAEVGFNANGSYTMVLPELSFFPTTGTWEFTDNDTKIAINNGEFVLDVVVLEEDRMTLELNYDNFKSEPTIYRLTFSRT